MCIASSGQKRNANISVFVDLEAWAGGAGGGVVTWLVGGWLVDSLIQWLVGWLPFLRSIDGSAKTVLLSLSPRASSFALASPFYTNKQKKVPLSLLRLLKLEKTCCFLY